MEVSNGTKDQSAISLTLEETSKEKTGVCLLSSTVLSEKCCDSLPSVLHNGTESDSSACNKKRETSTRNILDFLCSDIHPTNETESGYRGDSEDNNDSVVDGNVSETSGHFNGLQLRENATSPSSLESSGNSLPKQVEKQGNAINVSATNHLNAEEAGGSILSMPSVADDDDDVDDDRNGSKHSPTPFVRQEELISLKPVSISKPDASKKEYDVKDGHSDDDDDDDVVVCLIGNGSEYNNRADGNANVSELCSNGKEIASDEKNSITNKNANVNISGGKNISAIETIEQSSNNTNGNSSVNSFITTVGTAHKKDNDDDDDDDDDDGDHDGGGDDDDVVIQCEKNENKTVVSILHFKSVGTCTDQDATSSSLTSCDINTHPATSLNFQEQECQCYPEDLLTDGQELPFHETFIDSSEEGDEREVFDLNPAASAGRVDHTSGSCGPTDHTSEASMSPGDSHGSTRKRGASRNSSTLSNVTKLDIIKMRQDLLKAQDQIHALESNLRTMRAEKLDLLGQMKQLYATLDSKEEDFNKFVKNFEEKISKGNEFMTKLIEEKASLEKINKELEAKLQNALEQCVSLNLDLDLKNQVIDQLNIQLESLQVSCSESNLSSLKNAPLPRSATDDELLKPGDWQNDTRLGESLNSSEPSQGRSIERELNLVCEESKNLSATNEHKIGPHLQEVLQIPISNWKANHILIWLEQDLNMGYYSQQCRDNVKSGKVLLTMTDQELDSAFGLQSPIHRRKLRIAIESLRDHSFKKYPAADQLRSAWISSEWLAGLGLPQFGPVFEAQLVDGRLLNYLTAKDLEKNFTMITKTHISSVLAGIQLLRLIAFDVKKLEEKRLLVNGEKHLPQDCVMWTNADVIKWIEDIDLQEYAHNLRKSGVHGALLVLDEKFTVESLASELLVPVSKSYLFRHLCTEYQAVITPARSRLCNFAIKNDLKNKTLNRTSSSSSAKTKKEDFISSSTVTFKGSLGRAFGKKMRKESIQVISTPEPVRLSTGLLDLYEPSTSSANAKSDHLSSLYNVPCSTFSSLHSLSTTCTTSDPIQTFGSEAASNEISVSMPLSSVLPHKIFSEKPSEDCLSTLSQFSSSQQKSKTSTNKKSHAFNLRNFSANLRRRSLGSSSKKSQAD